MDRLTSKTWVEERKRRWGTGSPVYKSKVLAQFSEITDDTVFTPAMISDAVVNDRSRHATVKGRYGFDVARLGPDECLIYHNRDGYVRLVARWGRADTMESVGRFRRLVGDNRRVCPPTHVDATGLGAGVFDRLRELNYPVIAFNGGEKAWNPLKYKNRRAESYWLAREMMEAGLIDIEPEDTDLQAELMEVHFKVDSGGRTQIEAKEDITARIGHSPDRADAFVMALQKQAVLTGGEEDQEQEPPPQKEEVFASMDEREQYGRTLRPALGDDDFKDTSINDILETEF
jgi:phage terminase large subunit